MWENTSFGDTQNSGFYITCILSKPNLCACLVPKLPRNPPWHWLSSSLGHPDWGLWSSPQSPLCFWPLVLSSCSAGHSPCLFTCPQWHGYCKVFVLFSFLLQGFLWNNLRASGFLSPCYFLFSVYRQYTDGEYGRKLLKWSSEDELLLHPQHLSWKALIYFVCVHAC